VTNIIATPGSLHPKSGLPISALKELSKWATADFDWRRTAGLFAAAGPLNPSLSSRDQHRQSLPSIGLVA
jgi:hypothetical protein